MAIIIKTKKNQFNGPPTREYDHINYHILVRPVGTPLLIKFIALMEKYYAT